MAFEKDEGRVARLRERYGWDLFVYDSEVWERCSGHDVIVAYMPTGIVVRGMCPLLKSKWADPAVVVLDKTFSYAVPILGGHHGANEVALAMEAEGMKAVITTAMEFEEGLSVGVGCNRGTTAEEILDAICAALEEVGAGIDEVRVIATADLKRDEAGLIEAVDRVKKPIMFASREEINAIDAPSPSEARRLGYNSVAEGSSLLYARKGDLMLSKRKYGGVTIAIAR